MSVLFGHPTGNPNSHHAALAYWEAGMLEAFCVPWVPRSGELEFLKGVPGLRRWTDRLERRSSPELLRLPLVEGRLGEWWRMSRRLAGVGAAGVAEEANLWLMKTLRRECRRSDVHAVHSYEDCALLAFEQARKLGKACIYELPIAFHREWEERRVRLECRFSDWLDASSGLSPGGGTSSEQKDLELENADLVLAPSGFVRRSVERFSDRDVAVVPYGVDLDFWSCGEPRLPVETGPLRFVYAGHGSVRKGAPLLLDAWRLAGLKEAELEMVGPWQLNQRKLRDLPPGAVWTGPVSRAGLRDRFRSADVFVFPSCFEGFGLVILEAMASGLPVIASDATAAPEILDQDCGMVIPSENVDALVSAFRWAAENRGLLPGMGAAARVRASKFGWNRYREALTEAVAGLG
jgi:starch synthase